ncbi:MAG: hypothetical protein COB53_10435 [Elusimicrobia bacterium]|nr:MAG: hypothetical protein COB53_10435 [Elusimicrobiota bacterium]
MPANLDFIHLGLAAAALILLFLWVFEVFRLRAVRDRANAAEQELTKIHAAPAAHEFRIEQFGVLWYPTVHYKKKFFEIIDLKVGAPNCLTCGLPLSIGSTELSCAKCGFKCAESVASVAVLDQIAEKAKSFFQTRHPTGL